MTQSTQSRNRKLYCHRQGGLLFWRLGALGGSLYLSRRPKPQAWRIMADRLIRIRSMGDLPLGWRLLAYATCAIMGADVAALAML